ncbi:hypothetical protein GGF43_005337, partial [Coemansia sp. RSA 2618]
MEGRVAANAYKVDQALLDAQLCKQPIPTNVWWQNLIVEGGDQAVVVAPYMVKSLNESLVVCAPTALRENKFVASVWHDDWRMDFAGCRRRVVAFDAVSVTVRYSGAVSATVPLVKGAAFATVVLETPAAVSLSTAHAILSVDSRPGSGVSVVQLNNGATWLMYCEGGAALRQSGMSALASDGRVQGAVRMALVANGAPAIAALLSAKDAVPVGGSVGVHAGDRAAEFTIGWNVRGRGAPLVCAQVHHQASLAGAEWADDVGTYWSSKGPLRVARGAQWRWREELEPLGFSGPTPLSPAHRDKLRGLVAADAQSLTRDLAALPQDPYFFGKALARAARIALIADEVGDAESRDHAVQRAIAWLEPWLDGSNSNALVYDSEWFGIVSSAGLRDPHVDFGQGRYNDHHFHYGYFVYAAAALAKLHPEWARARRDALDLFARDYCSLSSSDSAFPFMRCFDFYEGHSWAAGLFPFADSRNQESTSEAINAYYAAYLYAQTTGRHEIAACVRAVLQLEARTTRTYWHLDDLAADIYPAEYSCDKAIVGILWSSKADYTTFFGENPEFIYGIQFLPCTPALALIVKREWIEKIWSTYLEAVADGSQTEAWREIIDLTYAVVDKEKTMERIARITSHDDGNSASNSYHWV